MKIYWGWKDVPELGGLSRSQRRKIVRDCLFKHGFGFWQFWIGLAAVPILSFLGAMAGVILESGFGFSTAVYYACGLLGCLIGCLIYGWVYYTVVFEKLRPHFREYLQSKALPYTVY